MLGAIPFLGPILQIVTGPIASVFNKFFDKQIAQTQADADVDKTILQNQRDMSQDRLALRIMQDMLLLPPVVWSAIIGWDTIMVMHYPDLVWLVPPYPPTVAYLPYMAFAYLLGATGLILWKRK